jgi:hypothetical protein
MSKIIMWIVIVGIVAIGGYFVFKPGNISENTMQPEETAQEVENMEEGKKMAFTDFMRQGGSYRCTVAQIANGTEGNGTVHFDGEMVRGEFNSVVNGLNIDSSLIVRDGYTYSWSSLNPSLGFKVKVEEKETAGEKVSTSADYSFNADLIGSYECEIWTSDPSMFVIPENVKFQEIGSTN